MDSGHSLDDEHESGTFVCSFPSCALNYLQTWNFLERVRTWT